MQLQICRRGTVPSNKSLQRVLTGCRNTYPFRHDTVEQTQEVPGLMRGPDIHQETLFSTVVPEQRVPMDHPLRSIREMVNQVLATAGPAVASQSRH